MIWIDIATPKYALFFSKIIPELRLRKDDILITARYSYGYEELKKILDLYNLDYTLVGNYGGNNIKDKFVSRLKRQIEFVNIFDNKGLPDVLICGSSVEGVQTAFGLGIPIIHFADTPIRGHKFRYEDMTILSKLTIPLSSLIFHPFVVPKEVYVKFGVDPKNIIEYEFIDICLWMQDIKKDDKNDFRKKYGLDTNKHTILIREEEYKAHYVKEKLPVIYEIIPELAKKFNFNIVIMPRYESDYLKENFSKYALILEEKLKPEEFYPFIDLLIGGGGTMNLEAAYLGIPVVSTRSLILFHDKYLIDNNLMFHSYNIDAIVQYIKENIGKKKDNKKYFCKKNCSVKTIINKIFTFLKQ